MKSMIPLLARLLMSSLFLSRAARMMLDVDGALAQMESSGMEVSPELFLTGAILVLVTGGISLLIGYKTRIGALLLILFMVLTTVIFHWDVSDPTQLMNLQKNVAIIGGLMMVVAFGPGLWSVSKS